MHCSHHAIGRHSKRLRSRPRSSVQTRVCALWIASSGNADLLSGLSSPNPPQTIPGAQGTAFFCFSLNSQLLCNSLCLLEHSFPQPPRAQVHSFSFGLIPWLDQGPLRQQSECPWSPTACPLPSVLLLRPGFPGAEKSSPEQLKAPWHATSYRAGDIICVENASCS